MKVFKIAGKNLKLLLRSRTSMVVIVFGPLLIMLLVGFAFNNPSASKLNIGYFAPERTNLTSSFVSALTANPTFLVSEFKSESTCINNIEQGKTHICIIFPAGFAVENNKTNEIVFYVDQSRANFVYAIIETVSKKIDVTSNQLSYQMTSDLLSVIYSTQKENSADLVKIVTLKNSIVDLSVKLNDMNSRLSSLDLSGANIDSSGMEDQTNLIKNRVVDIKDEAYAVIDSGQALSNDLISNGWVTNANATGRLNTFSGNLTDARQTLNVSSNKTLNDIGALNDMLNALSSDVATLNKRLDTAKSTTTNAAGTLTQLQDNINKLKSDIDDVKASVESINSQISTLKVTNAENIVNPIQTTIKPVSSKSSNLNFIFPYMLVLIIVFISIMLSSTMIIMEKTSKAYFRNFTTPTKDLTFILSVFITSFIVVIVQLICILIIAYIFLQASILTNVGLTLLLVFLAITLFNLIGMVIGYFFNSQEAVTMASISVGSVFLFLSNLILPLETMSAAVQQISQYNPYVVASELLKKITLFNSSFKEVYMDFVLILIYIVVVFIIALIVQKMSKIQYISKRPIAKQLAKKEDIIDKYFKLNSGVLLRNEKDLLDELKKMSDTTYQEYVDKKKNDFESWLIMNKNTDLAKEIGKARTRKEMIDIIEKYQSTITTPKFK